ncbi:unnamed protein product [Colias eurytheme]|nr:unnamed protein product [Colias eurytheme]
MINPQIVYQVPMIIDRDNKLNQQISNRDPTKVLADGSKDNQKQTDPKTNDKVFFACQMDTKLQPKILITNIRPKLTITEEVSALDLYEKRKRIRRLKHLTNRDNKESKKITAEDGTKNIITPDKMTIEMYNEFVSKKADTDNVDSDSEYEDNAIADYNKIIEDYGPSKENGLGKQEFLANFRLATKNVYKDKEMDRQERIIRKDSVASAYITAGRLDILTKDDRCQNISTESSLDENIPMYLEETGVQQQRKQMFLAQLKLTHVNKHYREGYEKIWQEVIKERKRRNGVEHHNQTKQIKLDPQNLNLDTNGQLKLLTEIKKQVNENNNLIKKRIDSYCDSGDSIKVLAEKNFSELNRLSKIANISIKHFSGQDTKKRDLNPGFDSENIQAKPIPNYTEINIPNITKLISLKNIETDKGGVADASMDESKGSAGLEIVNDNGERVRDFSCQVATNPWPGVEGFIKNYKDYDAARKKEIADLTRRNTTLRVESAYVTRNASRDSDRAKALLAERKNLANEEAAVRQSIQRLYTAIETIRNCRSDT